MNVVAYEGYITSVLKSSIDCIVPHTASGAIRQNILVIAF